MTILDMSPFEMAKKDYEQKGGGSGKTKWFSLGDGESKIIRILNGLVPYVAVGHSCTDMIYDLKASDVEAARAAGRPVVCPNCGQPLGEQDFLFERPPVLSADEHRYFLTPSGQHRSFVCLSSKSNATMGIIPTDQTGSPLHQCPVCSHPNNRNAKGASKRPSFRLFAVAVEREAETQNVKQNGFVTPMVTGVKDKIDPETGEPSVVIVDMGFKAFWQKIDMLMGSPDYSMSISYFDFKVTRYGSGLDTTYDVVRVGDGTPTKCDIRQYESIMPDIKGFLQAIGNPQYYVDNGFAVPGFTPSQPQEQHSGYQQFVQQHQGGYQQPSYAQQPQYPQVQTSIPSRDVHVGHDPVGQPHGQVRFHGGAPRFGEFVAVPLFCGIITMT